MFKWKRYDGNLLIKTSLQQTIELLEKTIPNATRYLSLLAATGLAGRVLERISPVSVRLLFCHNQIDNDISCSLKDRIFSPEHSLAHNQYSVILHRNWQQNMSRHVRLSSVYFNESKYNSQEPEIENIRKKIAKNRRCRLKIYISGAIFLE